MRKNNSIKNVTLDIAYFLVNIFIRLLLVKIIIEDLGAEYSGLDSFFSQVIGYLNLVDLGFSTAAMYKLYAALKDNDQKYINHIYYGLDKIYKVLTVGIVLIGVIFSIYINVFTTPTERLTTGQIRYYFLFYLASVIIPNFYIGELTIIQSTQKIYKLNIFLYSVELIKGLGQVALIYFFKNYLSSMLVILAGNIIKYILVKQYFSVKYPYKKDKNYSVIKELFSDSKNVFIHKISAVVIDGTDYITLSTFTDLFNVNRYANYNFFVAALKGLISKFYYAIMPSIGDMIAEGNTLKIREVFYKMLILTNYFAIFSSLGLYLYADDFVSVWVGSSYLISSLDLVLFIINFYVNTIMGMFVVFKGAKGLYKDDIPYVYAQAITNLVISIVLVSRYNITGVLVGTVIGNSIGLIYPKIKVVYKSILEEPISVLGGYYFKFLLTFSAFSFLTVGIKFLLDKWIVISDFGAFVVSVIVYTVFSALALLLLFFIFSEVQAMLSVLCEKIKTFLKNRTK